MGGSKIVSINADGQQGAMWRKYYVGLTVLHPFHQNEFQMDLRLVG